MSGTERRVCQNCKSEFSIAPEDLAFYEKIKVPPPTFCWLCRLERRLAWRNERRLFRVKSAKSGKDTLALYPPESGIKVYDEKEWWADDWDAMSYGRDYDFSKPFFVQFFELLRAMPHHSREVANMVNSDYCANAGDLKNCYLVFNSGNSENCAYGNGVNESEDCIDNSHIYSCEKCYGNFWIYNCYEAHFSSLCEDCRSVWFSKNCRGCSDCFGCVNLRNKKYHIFNQPHSKEEYRKKLAEMKLHTWSGLAVAQKANRDFWQKFPNKFIQGVKNTDVSGEYVTHSKNVKFGYLVREGENLKYVQYLQVPPNKDCYDISIWGQNNQLAYENAVCGLGTFNIKFCVMCWPEVRDLEYCFSCHSSSNLFGCVGLRKKEYCILNKQYPKEDYAALREKIIAHMNSMPYVDKKGRIYKYGEFYPIEFCVFGYNNALVNEHFPLSREEIEAQGYPWVEVERREFETTLRADELPDSIEDVKDSILKEIIRCSNCGRAYRIIAAELNFLRQERIPLPRTCVDCRHNARIAQRNKAVLYTRRCGCAGARSENGLYENAVGHFHGAEHCPNEFETSYSPDRPEIVYCEACYNAEVA